MLSEHAEAQLKDTDPNSGVSWCKVCGFISIRPPGRHTKVNQPQKGNDNCGIVITTGTAAECIAAMS